MPEEEKKVDNPDKVYWLHYILIAWLLFLLLQDLLAENLKSLPLIMKVVKYMDEGVSLGVIGLLCVSCLVNGRLLYRTNIDIPFLVFTLIAILSSIIQKVPFNIWSGQLLIYMKGFFIFYILANLPVSRRTLLLYLRAVIWAAGVFFFFGIVDFLFPRQFRALTGNTTFVQYFLNLPSVKSLFIHPLYFGWFMSFTSCFLFAFFSLKKKPFYIIAFFCTLVGCFLSLRAKAIVGMLYAAFTGFFLLVVKKQVKARFFLVLILFIVIVFLFFAPYIKEVFISKLNIYVLSENPADVARNSLYIKCIQIARDKFPFGAGMGRYGSWLSRVYYSPLYDEYGLSNVYLMSRDMPNGMNDTFWPMIIGENGFFGCFFYAAIFVIFLISVYRQFKNTVDVDIKTFQFGTFMILIESIIESIASPIYVQPPFTFFIFGALGICYALSRPDTLLKFQLTEPAR